MECLVLAPLSCLQGMFTAPQKLIQKRYDKLLDYCSRLERSSSNSSSSFPTSSSTSQASEVPPGLAKRDYEAMNALLVEELQRFNMAAHMILTNCVGSLVALLRGLMANASAGAPAVQQLPVSFPHIINSAVCVDAESAFTLVFTFCCSDVCSQSISAYSFCFSHSHMKQPAHSGGGCYELQFLHL